MPIRAIFYDLDGTLRIGRPSGRQFFADHAAELGLQITPQVRRQAARWESYYWAESPELRADGLDFPDEKAFWINYSQRQVLELGASPEAAPALGAQLGAYMDSFYRPEDVLMTGVVETLARLREDGLLLGVISNRHHPFRDYLSDLGIGQFFDFTLAAGEINSWKPNKAIFLHALGLAKVSASETIYVGDNYYADVLGARNAGLYPVLIDLEGIYDEPGCPVIQAHHQIFPLLEGSQSWLGNEK